MIWLGLALVLAGIAIWPFRREWSLKPMDAEARRGAPGLFARLSRGVTHYQWAGPAGGPVVVCVHGLTTPSFVWNGLIPVLAGLGYRVLTYDLYGRGYSDRPGGVQDRAFFLGQLAELLDAEGVTGPMTLIGYSMGGSIVTCFAAAHPDRVNRVVLIAPAGVRRLRFGWRARLSLVPGIGDWMMRLIYPAMHRKGTEAERDLPSAVPGIVDLQQAELDYRGFTPAVLASFRGILSEDLAPDHGKIASAGLPVTAILGADDALIPLSIGERLEDWHGPGNVSVIDGAGHGLTYTHAERIGAILTETLGPAA